jgi:aryl-alcohol dehydrogenase
MLTEALVVHAPGAEFQYERVNVHDELRDNEILVEMKATGVCHTDLNFRNEKMLPGLHPAVFGHEGERER